MDLRFGDRGDPRYSGLGRLLLVRPSGKQSCSHGGGCHPARPVAFGGGVAAGTWGGPPQTSRSGRGSFNEHLGAIGLVGLLALVSPQVPGLGVGAAGGAGVEGWARDRALARSAPFWSGRVLAGFWGWCAAAGHRGRTCTLAGCEGEGMVSGGVAALHPRLTTISPAGWGGAAVQRSALRAVGGAAVQCSALRAGEGRGSIACAIGSIFAGWCCFRRLGLLDVSHDLRSPGGPKIVAPGRGCSKDRTGVGPKADRSPWHTGRVGRG
jgi:hypothetical protein